MRGRFRKSELVESPPHRTEIGFRSACVAPSPASGARKAAPLGNRSNKTQLGVGEGRKGSGLRLA